MAGVIFQTVITRVQALLDDPNGQRFDPPYVIGFAPQCYEDLLIEFAASEIEYGDTVLEIPNFPTGAVDLSTYQVTGGVLEFMILPIALEYKTPGAPIIQYVPIPKVDKVLDTQGINGIASWELRSNGVRLSVSTAPVDLRIRFFGLPSQGLDDPQSSIVVRAMVNTLVYRLAGEIAGTNESPNAEARFQAKEHRSIENLSTLIIKQEQAGIRRFGRYNRRYPGSSMWGVPTVTS